MTRTQRVLASCSLLGLACHGLRSASTAEPSATAEPISTTAEPSTKPAPTPVLDLPNPAPAPTPLPEPELGVYILVEGGSFEGRTIPALHFKQTEVTIEEYTQCYQRGDCSKPGVGELCNFGVPDRAQHPVNCIAWEQAAQYCEWAGARLPDRWEWQWAARGREAARPYAWGKQKPTCQRAVMSSGGPGCGTDATFPVGQKPEGDTIDGLHDLTGNVWEWTSTQGEIRTTFLVKGGSWFVSNVDFFRVDYEISSPAENRSPGDGIRCVRDG